MTGRRPYEPPAIVESGPIADIIVDDARVPTTVPTTLAVSVALSYAIRHKEPALAAMIYPCRSRIRWTALPLSVQAVFGSICEELCLGDTSTDLVRKALFR